MKTVKTNPADTETCPNCREQVTVPKSTRSFICRWCDAVIKVIAKDDGIELKVVGKSVDDDPTYQSLEARVVEIKRELADLHARYEKEMARDHGKGGSRTRTFGVLTAVAGLPVALLNPAIGGALVGAGVVATVAGMKVNSSRKWSKEARAGEISREIERLGAERDLLQRKAARLKTQV